MNTAGRVLLVHVLSQATQLKPCRRRNHSTSESPGLGAEQIAEHFSMSMHAKRSQMKKRVAVGSLRLTAKMQGSQQSRLPSKNGDIAPKIKRKDRIIIIRICVQAKKKRSGSLGTYVHFLLNADRQLEKIIQQMEARVG